MSDKVLLQREGPVAHIVLNRPDKLNALDLDCLNLLEAHLRAVRKDSVFRAIIVRGAGKAFCAGADLGFLGDKAGDPDVFGAFLESWHRTFQLVADCPLPTIAVAHGFALAGGFELLQVCDLAILADDAKVGDQHAQFGLFPGGGSTQRLPRLIGQRRAKWLLYSGEWIAPEDALAYGLVNEVVAPELLAARSQQMAELLASRSPRATAAIKEALRVGEAMDLRTALDVERKIAVEHMQTEDVQVGLEAFRTGTRPVFRRVVTQSDDWA